MTKRLLSLVVIASSALLSACGSVAPAPTGQASAPPAVAETNGTRAFEKQQRERASVLEQQGALLEASQAWEVLALLNPSEYEGRLAALQKRIEANVQENLARARQELKRGDPLAAEPSYLAVIALQPQNKEAIDALRGIERARNRQEHLLKPGRTLPAETAGKRAAPAMPPAPGNPLLMEQASNLASQGDTDEAIELMTGQLKSAPGDTAARDLLADLLYKKAQALQPKDAAGAQATLKRCLQVSPRHPACSALAAAQKPSGARPAASSASAAKP